MSDSSPDLVVAIKVVSSIYRVQGVGASRKADCTPEPPWAARVNCCSPEEKNSSRKACWRGVAATADSGRCITSMLMNAQYSKGLRTQP